MNKLESPGPKNAQMPVVHEKKICKEFSYINLYKTVPSGHGQL